MAADLIPASDVSPWNLLHDGHLVSLARAGSNVSMVVTCPYLRERFEEPGEAFVLKLLDCNTIDYTPYDEAVMTSLEDIASDHPDFVSAELKTTT